MGFKMTLTDIDRFLIEQERKGLSYITVNRYQNAVERFYDYLPEGKIIKKGSLLKWRDELLDGGLAPASVNVLVTACNNFLEYVGHREYQLPERLKPDETVQPELTRSEYLRLLSTAKAEKRERMYMIIKTIGNTGVHIQDLPLFTVEAVNEGRVVTPFGNRKQVVRLPVCLRAELMDYIRRNGIETGPVFVTRSGAPVMRTAIAADLKKLGSDARLPEGKATAKALRRLWKQTRANIESNMELLIDQAMERQLEEEQLVVGWNA